MKAGDETPVRNSDEATEDIIETYRSLIGLTLVEYSSLGASAGITGIFLLVSVVFLLFFLGFGAAWWIGESLRNIKAGFFIVGSGFAIITFLVWWVARKKVASLIRDIIIRSIYDKD